MPESGAMTPEETINKSILDKPLHQLTEDDISQLTREDCRRFLKDKGMRRPSWNKSQAIQQVISLKALLEPASDSDAAAARKKLHIPRPRSHPPNRVSRGTSADTEISVSADESVPPKDPDLEPDLSGDLLVGLTAADNESVPPRTTGVANVPAEQMTIFYCGKVFVYDDVPAEKARAIMQLAASPLHFPQETPYDGTAVVRSFPRYLQASSVKVVSDCSMTLLQTLHTVKLTDNSPLQREESNILREETSAEGPASRKASVQRYREKRKDRFRSKRKVGASFCSSLDIYLNHHIGNQAPNEHSGRSDVCSPTPIRQPSMPNSSGSLENNIVKSGNLSAVMDDKVSDPSVILLSDTCRHFNRRQCNLRTLFLKEVMKQSIYERLVSVGAYELQGLDMTV